MPDLPSPFRPVALREGADAMARAVALAPEQGAGTLTWVGALRRAEAAVVLEPELPLGAARLALHAAANALA
ncbi:MAG: biotin/lipoate--protein ligase family protein, partial [Acetobacteraceae bacterium]|nr:biotin/lipoate--protein ligase family protein [Acetobacteraceae bacterium]